MGKAVFKSATDYAFKELNLRKIHNDVLGTNIVSINFNKKAGMKEECVLREEKYRKGRYVDLHVFGLLRSEWDSSSMKNLSN